MTEPNTTNDTNVVRRSLAISFGGRYSATALQFVSVIVLSRLLTPQDIGIYTVGLVIVNIAHMIRDLGISNYILQEKNLTKEKVGAALSLSIFVAWSLGTLVIFTAPFLAIYIGEASITEVSRVVAINFFIIPLGCFAPALLKRDMRFGTIFKLDIAQIFTNVTVAILLAYAEFGYMSMAWASVLGTAVRSILSQTYLPNKYRTLPTFGGILEIIHFGKYVVSSNLLKELDAVFLNTLAGKYLGLASVGYLSRAVGYEKLFQQTMAKGAEPVIYANIAKNHRDGFALEKTFYTTFDFVTNIAWTGLGFLALMSLNVITILYGEQWLAAVPLASLLCLTGCFATVTRLAQVTMQATGEVRIEFIAKLIATSARICILVLTVKAGMINILASLLLAYLIESIAITFLTARRLRLNIMPIVRASATNACIAIGSLACPLYFYFTPEALPHPIITELAAASCLSAVTWVALAFVFDHPIAAELRKIVSRLRSS